ncbi:MAG: hypothetical protein WBW33_10220 [Bryobacteraceae bacterium]
MTKTLLVVLLLAGLSIPATAQWQRLVLGAKGDRMDTPSEHPLSYFTSKPFLRDESDDLCVLCTPEGKARSGEHYSIRTEVKSIGVLAGYHIVDVFYHVGSREINADLTDVKWKSILVRVGPDRFKEIFHLSVFYTTVSIAPSRIIQSGNERILASMDGDGGNGGGCWEGYWWFDKTGPHPLNFDVLSRAIAERVPKHTAYQMSCSNLNLETQEVKAAVQKIPAACHACDWIGEFTARFHLDGANAIPVDVQFKPSDAQ